jgi:hypothetical protein
MVKKVTRTTVGVNSGQVGHGYVLNEELLDEILGEYDRAPNKRPGQKLPPTASLKVPQATTEAGKGGRKVAQVVDDEEEGSEDEEYYEVEKILEKRQVGKRCQYLVKWHGFGEDQATWEPPSNLSNVKNMIKEFEMQFEMNNQGHHSTNASNTAPTQQDQKKTLQLVSQASKDITKK